MAQISKPPPAPRRRPRQSRSRELVRAIREAGRAILEEEGAAALTTNHIAARAGVGIASVYRYYPNKQAILADVFDEQVRAIDRIYRQTLGERNLESLPLKDQIRHMIETPVQLSLQLLKLHREFFQHHYPAFEISYRRSPDGEHSWVEWGETWWQQILLQRHAELRNPDPVLAARVMLMAVRGAIDAAVERQPDLLEDPAFIDGLVDMACRYLLSE